MSHREKLEQSGIRKLRTKMWVHVSLSLVFMSALVFVAFSSLASWLFLAALAVLLGDSVIRAIGVVRTLNQRKFLLQRLA